MQNLFEFFLCMAAALWPLSVLSRRHNGLDTTVQDALLGVLILIPAGFVFGEDVRRLPPALQSSLFIPHVGSYVAGYVLMARAVLMALPPLNGTSLAICCARRRQLPHANRNDRLRAADAGLLLARCGVICWDILAVRPQRDVVAAAWLVYAGYFHERMAHGVRAPRVLAALLWTGLLFIVLTLTWINLSRLFVGMHNYA